MTKVSARKAILACGAAIALVMTATPALAQQRKFDLPAQSATRSIPEFARQAGIQVIAPGAKLRGLQTPALRGTYDVREGLRRLIAGTGLQIVADEGSTITLGPSAEKNALAGAPNAGENASASLGEEEVEAAEDADANQTIVVTGTHIRNAAPVGTPLRTVGRKEIDRSGYTAPEQIVQALPQNFRGGASGASADASFSGGSLQGFNSSFGSGVNLRGLGTTATLVLVNGHRVPSSGSGYFSDISTIPVSAIDHIDVLTDGASAIYGSDAVAGVINFVLKRRDNAIETGFRYGMTTDGALKTYGGFARVSKKWSTGAASLDADFTKQGELDASERSFTSGVPSPTSVFPAYKLGAIVGEFTQTFGDLDVHADAQFAKKHIRNFYSAAVQPYKQTPHVERWGGLAGARYGHGPWSIGYDFSGGRETNDLTTVFISGRDPIAFFAENVIRSQFWQHDAKVDGTLLELPAGGVKLAAGASYRREKFSQRNRGTTTTSLDTARRGITAGFAEMRIPIFSDRNAIPGFAGLDVSGAVRYDHYSDFGNTTNPKIGVSWYPVRALQLRGAYSTSFRAPATGAELVNSDRGILVGVLRAFPGPDGSAPVPVLFIVGAQPGLKPETAKNLTVGFDADPAFLPRLRVSGNYYDIRYKNQLAAPPFSLDPLNDPALAPAITHFSDSSPIQQIVTDAQAAGAPILDLTFGAFGPDPFASTLFLYDLRTQNLSETSTRGLDFTAIYNIPLRVGQLDLRGDLTKILKFKTALTSTSPQISRVNTVGFPSGTRARFQGTWSNAETQLTVSVNYIGSYKDTTSPTPRRVSAWTTLDLSLRHQFGPRAGAFGGLELSAAALNLFSRRPPFVASSPSGNFSGFHYDPANASPLGRYLSFEVRKRW